MGVQGTTLKIMEGTLLFNTDWQACQKKSKVFKRQWECGDKSNLILGKSVYTYRVRALMRDDIHACMYQLYNTTVFHNEYKR